MGGCAEGTEQCLQHCQPYQVPSGTVWYSPSIFSRSVMNWPRNYEGACRTAPAVPGLLFSRYYLIPPCAVSLVLLGALQVYSIQVFSMYRCTVCTVCTWVCYSGGAGWDRGDHRVLQVPAWPGILLAGCPGSALPGIYELRGRNAMVTTVTRRFNTM